MNSAVLSLAAACCLLPAASARDIRGEMRLAAEFGKTAESLVTGNDLRTWWSTDGSHLAYRVNGDRDTFRFFKVDLKSGVKEPAFDHGLLAKALSNATSRQIDNASLPLDEIEIFPDGNIALRAFGKAWKFAPSPATLLPHDFPPREIPLLSPEEIPDGRGANGQPSYITLENGTSGEIEIFWIHGGERTSYGIVKPGASFTQDTWSGHVWLVAKPGGEPLAALQTPETPGMARITGRIPAPSPKRDDISPDGKWRALIRDHNLFVESISGGETIPLGTGGTLADGFTGPLKWSPDSTKLIAFRTKAVETRKIHIVQSSPPDQIQPRLKTIDYAKAGDEIPQSAPHLFDMGTRREIPLDRALFNNPWAITELSWAADSSEFSFVYNQRGHQLMRILGIRGDSGAVRVIHEETSKTFIDYSQKFFMRRLPATGEILWASERDGHNHLYRIDTASGTVKNAVTQGNLEIREVLEVDEKTRRVLFKMVGVAGQDPYHQHIARVNFDGTGLTMLTNGDGNHRVEFSPDGNHLIDTWSRVDQPPVVELRNAETGALIAELSRADDSALLKTGWNRPERFVAKGRDGLTDIHGIIIRPTNFDPSKKYPVVEDIYAGPHDHFVPKSYAAWSGRNAMAELGFVVVGIDGMGTNWRGKAFHDVCWKNLADAGLPDRIAWIKAAAGTRPWMDLSRVGIYGGSAGGQSTLAALLHHPNFYKVGVADCGCHDNRMDKIWWNEAWMGWPVDESYARNSNVTHAGKLQGKLMLIAGEMDTNVDPASTAQVVAALQRAEKDFDYLPLMNAGHGAAETGYGSWRRAEFLVRHLSGQADSGN